MSDVNIEKLEQIYRSERKNLERMANKRVGYGNGPDVVQETFFRLLSKTIGKVVLTPAFLSRCVQNAAIDQFRHQKRIARLPDLITEEQYAAPVSNPQQLLLAGDALRHVESVINSLPERTRHIFVLNRFHDCTYQEIASVLGLSYSTVEREIAKAMLACQKALDPSSRD